VIELVASLMAVLVAVTISSAILYYKQVRKIQVEYEKAKSVIEDVVLSFNRELRKEVDRTELVAYKVEGNAAKADNIGKRIDALEKTVESVKIQAAPSSEKDQYLSLEVSNINSRIASLEALQEAVKTKVSGIEEEMQKFVSVPEMRNEPAIQIRRDKALAALTGTEISVLEMLVTEGSKTAPEIKERVKLSREHTARLMKKLYEEGYLERETGKIPFRYSAKKEMEKVLKKPEPQNP
jgi:predicted DNA-binding transcriptional regulator